jgi:hypothetical protein
VASSALSSDNIIVRVVCGEALPSTQPAERAIAGYGMGIGFALAVCGATDVASSRTTLTAVVRKLLDWTEVFLRFPKSRFPIDNSIPARI